MDFQLRELERRVQEAPDDALARRDYIFSKQRAGFHLSIFEELAVIETVSQDRLQWLRDWFYRLLASKRNRKNYVDPRLRDHNWLTWCAMYLKIEARRRKGSFPGCGGEKERQRRLRKLDPVFR